MIVSQGVPLTFAPQALAETAPMASVTGYFYADQGLDMIGRFAAYSELYRCQPWLATVVDKIAASAARLSFNVWDNSPTSGKVLDAESDYARFWRNPCPVLPLFAFQQWTFSTYELYGEAFWLKIRNPAGQVRGVLPMHPSRTMVRRLNPDEARAVGYDVQYVFSIGVASAGLLRVPADDVVPFLRYNPDNLMRGLSRVEALRSTLENEDASRRATQSFWRRGARPSLMISAPGSLGARAYERLAAKVGMVHGGVDNAGGTLVLEEGAKPVPVQLSAEEMQYIEGRKLNREEVCARYDIPPPVVHILDKATFSNITEQMRSMYRDSMTPRLEDYESTVDFHLRPEFDPAGDLRGSFALDEVLRGDFESRATATGTLIERGVMKPSEARPLFDLPDAGPVADRLYANAALQELGRPSERVTVTEAAAASPVEQALANDAADEVANQQAQEGQPVQPTPVTPLPSKAARRRVRRQRISDETESESA